MRATIYVCFLLIFISVQGCKLDELPSTKFLLEKPSAEFIVTNDGCTSSCTMTFTSQSTTATDYFWEISDGSISTQASFVKVFTSSGSYTVKLTVTNKAGSSQKQVVVSVKAGIPSPIADFSIVGSDCIAPCEVAFINKSLNASSYIWSFGDNSNTTEINPTHLYREGGNYNVSLTATGAGGTASKTQQITIRATAVPKLWDKTFGGDAEDVLMNMVMNPDGSVTAGGYSYSGISADKSESSRGSVDYWITKIDGNGIKLWDKTYGGSSLDFFNEIIVSSEGGYLLGGTSFSNISSEKSESNRGFGDYWIVKVNENGTRLWDKTYGGSADEYLNFILQNKSDGSYLLAGKSDSGISGEKTQSAKGGGDYWIVKINSVGVKLWDKSFGGAELDELTSIVPLSDGGYLLAGFSASSSSVDKSSSSRGTIDYWIIKIDAFGNRIWDRTFGGSGVDKLYTTQLTSDGKILLVGSSNSGREYEKSEASKGGLDYWIIKINSTGDKEWDKTFGGNGDDEANSVFQNSDGSFIIGGYSKSEKSGNRTDDSRGNQEADYWILKIDANGNKIWDKAFGGSGKDELLTMVGNSANNSLFLGGYSKSSVSGEKSQASKGNTDYWLLKIRN